MHSRHGRRSQHIVIQPKPDRFNNSMTNYNVDSPVQSIGPNNNSKPIGLNNSSNTLINTSYDRRKKGGLLISSPTNIPNNPIIQTNNDVNTNINDVGQPTAATNTLLNLKFSSKDRHKTPLVNPSVQDSKNNSTNNVNIFPEPQIDLVLTSANKRTPPAFEMKTNLSNDPEQFSVETMIETYIDIHTELTEDFVDWTVDKSTAVIPKTCYTCWHTDKLPYKMRESFDNMVKYNSEIKFELYDEPKCRQFIQDNFADNNDVLWAYDNLVPSSYKSDLWRFCVLYKLGGIYLDIKYGLHEYSLEPNHFTLANLCDREHFVMDRLGHWSENSHGLYTALIVAKAENPVLEKCISTIVQNVKNREYGWNALYPTGPGLLGQVYFGNLAENYREMYNLEVFFDKNGQDIIYKNRAILTCYPEYRCEQLQYRNNLHYTQLWSNSGIYKLKTAIDIIPPVVLDNGSAITHSNVGPSILCILHIGNFTVFQKMKPYLDTLMNNQTDKYTVDLYINLVDYEDIENEYIMDNITHNQKIAQLQSDYPSATIVISENYGFDIGSFFNILDIVKQSGKTYDFVLKLHTKTNDKMRHQLLQPLLGDLGRIVEILDKFKNNSTIGCVGSKQCCCVDSILDTSRNKNHLHTLQQNFFEKQYPKMPFITGTMFWMRFSVLQSVYMKYELSNIYNSMNTKYSFDWNWYVCANRRYIGSLDINTFEDAYVHYLTVGKYQGLSGNLFHAVLNKTKTPLCRDGMIEHAYERLFAYAVEHCGQNTMYI